MMLYGKLFLLLYVIRLLGYVNNEFRIEEYNKS